MTKPCPLCGAPTLERGTKRGARHGGTFQLCKCPACTFSFVANPCLEFEKIYDELYYAGQGSDPMVDYAAEFNDPENVIRGSDWEGIAEVVERLHPARGRWLDFGCGTGALVRYIRGRGGWDIHGHDTGAWAAKAKAGGLPILSEDELRAQAGSFDVVTAIEVIEHVTDPVGFLRHIRSLLRPGGLLFVTTANAESAPAHFTSWPYVIPEIHVSFFTPLALRTALARSGFEPRQAGFIPGWEKMFRFRILKNLGVRKKAGWHALLPWKAISRLADRRFRLTQLPIGIAK